MIRLIRSRATPEDVRIMLEDIGGFIKLAVHIDRDILAGGGKLHADCEAVLLESGSLQENLWGADWDPFSQELRFEALMNVRPREANRSMTIQSPQRRERIAKVVDNLLRGVEP